MLKKLLLLSTLAITGLAQADPQAKVGLASLLVENKKFSNSPIITRNKEQDLSKKVTFINKEKLKKENSLIKTAKNVGHFLQFL